MDFTHHGWCVSVHPSAEQIAQAKAMRAERDARYGNHYREAKSDEKWVGDLGEIILNEYFKAHLPNFTWLDGSNGRSVAGEPDFMVGRVPVEIKTVKRQKWVTPELIEDKGYGCQITFRQTDKYPDHTVIVFGGYSTESNCYQLFGGIRKSRFDSIAKKFGPGEKVHKNYTVRQGHMIEQGKIKDLGKMEDLIRVIRPYSLAVH